MKLIAGISIIRCKEKHKIIKTKLIIENYVVEVVVTAAPYYRRSGFNCEYLLIANCEFFYVSQLIDSQT